MKRFNCLAAALGLILAVGLATSPARALTPEKAGAFYVGESALGDGFIGGGDVTNLMASIKGQGAAFYANTEPPNATIQDVNSDGFLGALDTTILNGWIKGTYPVLTVPTLFIKGAGGLQTLLDYSGLSISSGDSLPISALLRVKQGVNPVEIGTLRSGFGVVFTATAVNPLCSPLLIGHNPNSGVTTRPDIIQAARVHAFTYLPEVTYGGWATVKVLFPAGCNDGDTIRVATSVPSDLVSGCGGKRVPNTIDGPSYIINVGPPGRNLLSVTMTGPLALDELAGAAVTATCHYTSGPDDACVDAGGFTCGSATGDVSLVGCTVTAGQILGPNGGSGSVTVTAGAFNDLGAIIVNNDDTVSTVSVLPASFSTGTPGASQVFTCTATYTDTFTESCLSGTALAGACGSYVVGTGTWTAPGSGTCNGTITGTWGTPPVSDPTPATVALTCTPSSITCSVASITEGAAGTAYTCADNCGTDVTATTTVGGAAACTKAGAGPYTIAAPEANCSTAVGACTITQGALPVWPVTVIDDIDAQTGVLCTPDPLTEGALGVAFVCTQTWNEGVCAAGNVSGTVTLGGGCARVPATNTLNVSEANCTAAPAACVFTNGTFTDSSTVTNNDTITAVSVLPASFSTGTPGATQVFTCTATCSDTFTENCLSGTAMVGGCGSYVVATGTWTAPGSVCNGTITGTWGTPPVSDPTPATVAFTCAPTSITCTVASITEGAAGTAFTCTNNCGTNVTSTVSVGGVCTKAGAGPWTIAAPEANCSSAAGACTITQGALPAWPVTVIDDGDVIISTVLNPASATVVELASRSFVIDQTWSEACVLHPAGTGWAVTGSTCTVAGSVTGGGVYTAGTKLGPLGCAENVDTNETAPAAITVTNDDTVSAVDITPNTAALNNNGDTQAFLCQQTWSDAFVDSCLPATADTAGCGTYVAATGVYTCAGSPCSDAINVTVNGHPDSSPITCGCTPGTHASYAISSDASVPEGGTITAVVNDIDTCGNAVPMAGETVSITGDCTQGSGSVPGTLADLAPSAKTGADTAADTVNGVSDLALAEGTPAVNAGSYWVPKTLTMSVNGWSAAGLPGGAIIDSVTLKIVCGRNGAAGNNPINYNIGGGNVSTGLICSDAVSGGPYKAEMTYVIPGPPTQAQINALVVSYTNNAAANGGVKSALFDTILVDVAYHTTGPSGIVANDVLCGAGGSCSLTAANIGGEAVAPATTIVANDDVVAGAVLNPASATVVELASRSFVIDRTWSDTCIDNPAGTGWAVTGSTCTVAGSVTAGGVYTAGTFLGPLGCAENVDTIETAAAPITVTNDDTVSTVSVLPAAFSTGTYGGTQVYTCTATYTDTFTESCLSGTALAGACGSYVVGTGTWTAPGSGGTCNGTITGTWGTPPVSDPTPATVAFNCVATGITCTVNSITEGAAGTAFTCTDTCGVNVTSTVTVGGAAACTKAGAGPWTIAAPEANCSTAVGACTITQGAFPVWPVTVIDDIDAQTGVLCTPDPLIEGALGVAFVCTQTWNEGVCAAGNVSGTVTLGGGCARAAGNTLNVSEANCTAAPAACVFTNGTFTDSSTVTNNDTITAVSVLPASFSTGTPGASQVFTCTATCSDTFTENCLSGTAMGGACGAYVVGTGTWTAPGSGTCNGTITGTWGTPPVSDPTPATVALTCIPTSITCSVASITEGAAGTAYTCANNCGTDVTATTTVGGAAACTKAGAGPYTIAAPEANCSSAVGACTITQGALPVWPVTVIDDIDAQTGVLCTPDPLTEGALGVAFVCTQTWNEGVCAAGNVSGTVTLGGGCARVPATNTLNVSEANCTAAPAACVFTNGTFTDSSTVTNNDTITAVSVLPASFSTATPGATQVFTCTATCSDTFTENCLSGTAMGGACGSYVVATGTWTAPGSVCNGTITGTWGTPPVSDPTPATVAFTCAPTSITCTVASITEGAAGTAFTCTNNCGTNVTSTVTVGGASACTKAGAGPWTIAAPEANCSSAAGSCTITQAGLPAWPVTVTDDGDAPTTAVLNPLTPTVAKTATQQFTIDQSWNEGSPGCLTHPAGTGWVVNHVSCSPDGTVSGTGLYTAGNVVLNCTDQVDTTETAPTNVTVTGCVAGTHASYAVVATNPTELGTVTYSVRDIDTCGGSTPVAGETVTIAAGNCSFQPANLRGPQTFAAAGDFPGGWTTGGTAAPGWENAGQGGFNQGSVRFPGTAYNTAPPANATSTFTVSTSATGYNNVTLSGTYCACRTDSQTEAVTIQYDCGGGFVPVAGTSFWTDGGGTNNNCACAVGGQDRHNFSYNLSSMNAACNNNAAVQVRFTQGAATPAATERTWIDDITISASSNTVILANHVACGAGGACTLSSGNISGQPVASAITTNINDETVTSGVFSPALPANMAEGANVSYNIVSNWSDGCLNENYTGNSTCSGGCTGGAGTCTALTTACAAVPANCAITSPGLTTPGSIPITNVAGVVSRVDISPIYKQLAFSGTQAYTCTATLTDACTANCLSSTTDQAGCGTYVVGTGVYTAPASGACTDTINATYLGVVAWPADIVVPASGAVTAPVISYVWPLRSGTDDRYRLNAHPAQHLTAVLNYGTGGVPAAVEARCSGPSTVFFTCTGSGADPDWDCTPSGTLSSAYVPGGSAYSCTVTASNTGGSVSSSGSMSVAVNTVAAKGGLGGGYVGGNVWDSATSSIASANVNLTIVNTDDGLAIGNTTTNPVKAYVQVIQGGVTKHFFTRLNGTLTIPAAQLSPLPIDEITIGYKCGAQRCESLIHVAGRIAKNPVRSPYYNYYQYHTYKGIDASTLTLRLPLMSTAFFGRNKAVYTGSIAETSFNNYIGPRQIGWTRARGHLDKPNMLRAALVVSAFRDSSSIAGGLDGLLFTPDTETSLSFCLSDNTAPPIRYALGVALPVNLVAPELLRTTWQTPCQDWTINTSRTDYQVWTWTPGEYKVIWALGAYMNASKFSLIGNLDLFGWPLYGCAVGMHGLTVPAGLRTAGTTIPIGLNADFERDLREDWSVDPKGYDPDPAADRRYLLETTPSLPYDPGRKNSTLLSGTYRLPNLTDSELGLKYNVANWDQRFYRKAIIMASGADFGPRIGMGVTGLALNVKIDDVEFTVFAEAYFKSDNPMLGLRDNRYWTGGGDSEVASIEQAGGNAAWADVPLADGHTLIWKATDTGGPTNYAAIIALSRGMFTEAPESDWSKNPSTDIGIALTFNPGSIVTVWHIGDPVATGNEVIVASDFPNMPEPVSPVTGNYAYPAPQWSNTVNNSMHMNRNGELWPDRSVTAANNLQKDAGSNNRYYVEFTRVGLYKNSGRPTSDLWKTGLAEPGIITMPGDSTLITGWRSKPSARTSPTGTSGYATDVGYMGTGSFNDEVDVGGYVTAAMRPYRQQRWDHMNIQKGDKLVIRTKKTLIGCKATLFVCVPPSVAFPNSIRVSLDLATCNAGTYVNWSALSCIPHTTGNTFAGAPVANNILNVNHIRYYIARQKVGGEYFIDDLDGRTNSFWSAEGPGAGTGNIRVHVPAVTPGALTGADGSTGIVPDLWDGLPTATGVQLEWNYSSTIFNTDAATRGGMGRKFNYNNRDNLWEDPKQCFTASDNKFVRYY